MKIQICSIKGMMLLTLSFSEALFLLESPGHAVILQTNLRGEKQARLYSVQSKASGQFDDETYWKQEAASLKVRNELSSREVGKLLSFVCLIIILFIFAATAKFFATKTAHTIHETCFQLFFWLMLGLLVMLFINAIRFIYTIANLE